MGHHAPQPIEMPIDRIRQPIQRLIHIESLGGLALIAGAVTALVLANSPLAYDVDHFWHYHLVISAGPIVLDESLVHWVNDALMTVFFFVAGLEIKRELVVGDLREPRKAALPIVAAFGGMAIPALVFVAVASSQTRNGWGIPMATDIAFAVGILALLGDRVPSRLKVFLLTLAIVDDLGAILVIAVFYTTSLNTTALAIAGLIVLGMLGLRALGVWWMPIYVLAGAGLWLAVFESGVHATLAGVACGLMAPAKPRRPKNTDVVAHSTHSIDELKAIIFDTRETKSVADRLIHGLHPFTAFLIVPIFALANTGVGISGESLVTGLTSSTGLAIVLGLVVGKPLGIAAASWVAVRTGMATLPAGTNWGHVVGVGLLGGIGFTVSLFITDLAYVGQDAVIDNAKIAVLTASVLASALGAAVLLKSGLGQQPGVDETTVDSGAVVPDTAPAGVPEPAVAGRELETVGGPSTAGPITFEELNATSGQSFLAGERADTSVDGADGSPSSNGAVPETNNR
jgi:NhaA family Na+:H+ antiporter